MFIIPSEDNANTQQVTLSNQHVFGIVLEENFADSPSCEASEEFHRLRIISFIIGEATFEIGFFESGYQLAVSITGETHNIIESLEKYSNGNVDELIKFYPSIEFLLCLIDRMKKENPVLSKLQLEVLLILFQQLRIDTDEEFKHVRMNVEQWIEKSKRNESELLFSNLGNEKWSSNQLLSHTFFSLAFSDIIGNVKEHLFKFSTTFGFAIYNPRYFNVLLSAIYGNELSRLEWVDVNGRKFYSNFKYSKAIFSVLDEIEIETERKGNESTFQNYPNCLLDSFKIEFSQVMDPRAAGHSKNDVLNKFKFNKHSFWNYIFSDYLLVQYLVRKCYLCETKKEREEYLQELKLIDLSAFYYAKFNEERKSLNRLSFAQLSIKHGLDTSYRYWGTYKKFPIEEANKLKKMIDYLVGFDTDPDNLTKI